MTITTPLTCDGFATALADYLERDDSPRVRAAVETHAASCAACGALLADLQQLRVDASGLPTLTPSRDLWAGVAERIATPVVAIDAGRGGHPPTVGASPQTGASGREERHQRSRRMAWLRPAAAAAALVLVTAGVTYFATREALQQDARAAMAADSMTIDPRREFARAYDSAQRVEGTVTRGEAMPPALGESVSSRAPRRPAQGPPARAAVSLASDQAIATALETVYDREIARLRVIIDERRALLDTATVGVIERSLTVIDQAIRESRAALARDPASAFLNEQFNKALEQKVELLRAAAFLPVRT
jgi:hypothetical protein